MDSKSQKIESYQFIKQVLIDVQELNKEQQLAFVKEACKDCPQHLSSLLKMLDIGNSELVDVLDKPAILSHSPDLDIEQEAILAVGHKINHYEIIKSIGSGGMGRVYSAKQSYPAERQVALKLLKNTPKQQLLISETQILARLNHPNIATLFEIDKSEDGQYFIAMELINGDDIITWCKNYQYSNKQIIELFQQLCSGISYAHEKNIIHCDIKPSNVLITEIDNNPTVKIIDFGISQFQEQSANNHEISGTPAYLAPEVLNGKSSTTTDQSRDVYALGILISKLLCNDLDTDLKAIINKATAYKPKQRYTAVSLLSHDLTRYLSKQTVSARDNSFWHTFKLLIQRRIGVVLVSGLILILSLASAYIAQTRQADIAIQQAKVAKIAQAEAEELSAFLTDLFNVANPERSNSEIITAVDLIDKAQDKLLKIESPSLSDARFMHTIGSIYTRMDKLDQAQIMIEKSLAIKEDSLNRNDDEVIAGLITLGLINKKNAEYELAESKLLKALESLENQTEPNEIQLAYVHNHLGNLYTTTKQVDKSIAHHKKAINLRKQKDNNKLLADSYNNLGVIYHNTKQWDLASKYYNLALEIYLKFYDNKHPYIGVAKNNIALIEEQRFNFDLSENLLLEVLDIWKSTYGKHHRHTISVQRNLALYYDRRMQFEKAFEIYDGLINHFKSIGNFEQEARYNNLKAFSYAHDGQFNKALDLHEQSLNLFIENAIKGTNLHARIYNQYAESLILKGDFKESEYLLNQSIKILETNFDANNLGRLFTLTLLADVYLRQEKFNASRDTYQEVLKYDDPSNFSNQKYQIAAHIGMGKLLFAQNQYQESENSLNKALTINRKINGEKHHINAVIYYQLALTKYHQDMIDDAKLLADQALEIQKQALPNQHKDLIETHSLLKKLLNVSN